VQTAIPSLGVIRPAMRVSMGRSPQVGDLATAPSAVFARRLAERYLSRLTVWAGIGLVLRQVADRTLVRQLHHHTQLKVAPRVALTVLAWPPGAPDQPTPQAPQPAALLVAQKPAAPAAPSMQMPQAPQVPQPRLSQTVELLVVRKLGALTEPGAVEQLAQRLAAREQRLEPEEAVQPGSGARALPASSSRPARTSSTVPLVVHRPPAGSADRSPQATAVPMQESVPLLRRAAAEELRQSGAAAVTALAGAELGQLTDQVLQAIDRRMLAHRERTGRI
jgi:hypothetical protein